MSETIIGFIHKINGVLTDVTSVILRDPTGTFGVRREDTLATVVAAGTPLVHLSTGRYALTFTDPAPNITYNYWVEYVFLGNTTTFEIENYRSVTGGGAAEIPIAVALPRTCISLARYAKLTGYSECAIMGVSNPSEAHGDCENPIWDQFQRDTLLYYLAEAQEEIELVTGYPLCPTYYADEEHPYRFPVHTRWSKVLAAGVEAESDVVLAASIDYSVEPALIGPLATSVMDTSEIHIFYPGSDREIEASRITIVAGALNIYIPRCRMVHPDFFATPEGGLAYEDEGNFLETVDVKRIYTDSSTNAALVWAHRGALDCPQCGCLTCEEHTETGCVYVRNSATGALDILQGTFASNVWTPNCNRCFTARPDKVRVSYLAGLSPITLQAETAVLRLAHAKMPTSICGCDVLKSMWTRDTHIPDFVSPAREAVPFGTSDGAWAAWRFANAIAVRRMHTW